SRDRDVSGGQTASSTGLGCSRDAATVTNSVPPRLDFGDARVTVERAVDLDADAGGRGRAEVDGALDQVVAGDAGQRDPGAPVPALQGESGDAVLAESHAIGGLDRAGVVILDGIDDDVIDGLAAVEVDLDPVGEAVGGGVVPAAVVTPVG